MKTITAPCGNRFFIHRRHILFKKKNADKNKYIFLHYMSHIYNKE